MSSFLRLLAFAIVTALAMISVAKAGSAKVSKDEAVRLMAPDNLAVARYMAHRLEGNSDSPQDKKIVLKKNGLYSFSASPISKLGFGLTHLFVNSFDDAAQPKRFTGILQHSDKLGRQVSTLFKATYRNVKDKLLVETIATKTVALERQRVALFFAAKDKTPQEKITKLDTGNLLEFVSSQAVKINKGEKFNATQPYYMFAFFLDYLGEGAMVGVIQGAAPDDSAGEITQSFVHSSEGFYVAVAEVTPAFFDFKRPYLKVLRQVAQSGKTETKIESVVDLKKVFRR